jgi:hypothetical protein
MPEDEQGQGGWRPDADPSLLTEQRVERAAIAERDYVKGQVEVLRERVNGEIRALVERLNAIDRATTLLSETVNRVPTETQLAVGQLAAVVGEQFNSVDKQFAERDTRSEREARDNKLAVDAAFAAQEKQAVAQNEANTTAINKSELATTETINKLAELFKSDSKALSDKIDDLKQRVQALESGRNGATEGRVERRAAQTLSLNAVVGMFTVGALLLGLIVTIIVKA